MHNSFHSKRVLANGPSNSARHLPSAGRDSFGGWRKHKAPWPRKQPGAHMEANWQRMHGQGLLPQQTPSEASKLSLVRSKPVTSP